VRYCGNLLVENRNGLIVGSAVWPATAASRAARRGGSWRDGTSAATDASAKKASEQRLGAEHENEFHPWGLLVYKSA
jgi:hypothetical protein